MASTTVDVKESPAVVVTGASGGIGRELALIAAREAVVVLIARSEDKLAQVAGEIENAGGHAHVLSMALGADPAAPAIAAFLAERGLHCDVLVNNAGYGLIGQADSLDAADQVAMVDLNVRALTELTLAFLPGMMQRRRGGVLQVASVAGFLPGPNMAVYYATKAFVRSFSMALWEECRRSGVTVTALCPGPVETDFFARATGNKPKPKMFALMPGGDARSVAQAGWTAFKLGRRVVVPGLMNKITTLLVRFLPDRLVLMAVRKMQKARTEP